MNLALSVAVYASLVRAAGLRLDFPGSAAAFGTMTQVVDAEQLAEAAAWAAVTPQAAGEVFNVANGDPTRWSHLWPAFADYFGVPAGGPRPIPLSSFMPELAPLWRDMAAKYGLAQPELGSLVNWGFLEFMFAIEYDIVLATRQDPPGRLHQAPGYAGGLLEAVRRVSPRPDHPDLRTTGKGNGVRLPRGRRFTPGPVETRARWRATGAVDSSWLASYAASVTMFGFRDPGWIHSKENNMSQPEEYDVVVLGSGAAGKLLAWTLASQGRHTAVVERRYVGGSCPNIACLPSKNVIHGAKVADYFRRGAEFGIANGDWKVDMAAVRDRKRRMVDGLVEMHLAKYRESGAELVMGQGRFVAPMTIEVALNAGGTRVLRGQTVIIDTGSRARMDDTTGLAEARPLTHVEALDLGRAPGAPDGPGRRLRRP